MSRSNIQIRYLSKNEYIQSKNLPSNNPMPKIPTDTPVSLHMLQPIQDPSRQLSGLLNAQKEPLNSSHNQSQQQFQEVNTQNLLENEKLSRRNNLNIQH